MPEPLSPPSVAELRARPAWQNLWRTALAAGPELRARLVELVQIPAPTFEESVRGDWAARELRRLTGEEPQSDELGNRWVSMRGALGPGPRILLSAHLDTVFAAGTDCTVREANGRLIAPGIGDNGAGLCVLLTAAGLLHAAGRPFRGELLIAANVGEEGLGDLRGIRALCERFGPSLDGALALDGHLGQIVGQAVGSVRFKLSVDGPGGHSWKDFGRPSAIHHLVKLADKLAGLQPPPEPRSSFTIGVIQGGTSVNSIAAHAELLLDLRSVAPETLAQLEADAKARVAGVEIPAGLTVAWEEIGRRPAGDAALTRQWCEIARAAHRALGLETEVTVSSTDANIPLSRGVKASTLGMYIGGEAHTLGEWLDPATLAPGLELTLLCTLAATERLG